MKIYFIIFISLVSIRAHAGPLRIDDVDDVYPVVPNWEGLTVLHIGDSHVSAGFKKELTRLFKAAGANYRPICWVGSRSKSWVASGKLKRLLKKHRPDVVVVTLGTNAMKNPRPDLYSVWVHTLVEQIEDQFCYWIGPPPLLDDLVGFNEMLHSSSKPCRCFDSRQLNTPKRKDGKFHLTKAQGEAWAKKVWEWMNGELTVYLPEKTDAF
ncbi:MAG: SGNH/GDSL hydrolase family protein [Proteobacteria bacterium]|nr:SGNH/GDSL hydrolase family protein [Pseudomonadota bacterium]